MAASGRKTSDSETLSNFAGTNGRSLFGLRLSLGLRVVGPFWLSRRLSICRVFAGSRLFSKPTMDVKRCETLRVFVIAIEIVFEVINGSHGTNLW